MLKNSKPMSSSSATVILNYNGTLSMIQIPSVLVKSYGDVLPSQATLKIDDSGKSWRVKVEKFKDQYFFTEGWEEFAQAVDLSSWDYLTFNSATLFECRETERDHTKEKDSGEEDRVGDEEEASRIGKKWSFIEELKINNAYRLRIPYDFAVSTGILTTRKVKLKNAQGREWPIALTNPRRGKFCLTAGWNKFLVTNKVTVGSIMSFHFIPDSDNAIEARLLKVGTNKAALFQYVKQRGGKYEIVASSETSSDQARGRPESSLQNKKRDNDDHTTDQEDVDCAEKSRKISKKMEKHDTYRQVIPEDSVKDTGIPTSNGEESRPKKSTGRSVLNVKEKANGEKVSPSDEQLRNAISQILKEVDFDTATFIDIWNLLVKRFDTDLTPRQSSIKSIIQEELMQLLADHAEEDEDGFDSSEKDKKNPSAKGGKA